VKDHLLATLPAFQVASKQMYTNERGVVFTARAEQEQLNMIMRTVKLMRLQNRMDLLVEVFFSESFLPQHELCNSPEVKCRRFYEDFDFTPSTLLHSGFSFCIYAIALSRFKEVIFLDVDAVPMRDFTYLFDEPAYKETGQLFYADFWGSNSSNVGETARLESVVWDFVKVKPYPTREMESSVLLINKELRWREVNLALHLARHRQLMDPFPPRGYPKVVHGDKDIWRIAFLFLRTNWQMARPAMLGHFTFFLFFMRESFGHIGLREQNNVLFVHQPKIMDLPRWKRLNVALLDVHCRDPSRDFFTIAGPKFWQHWRCVFRYDYDTGRLHGREKPVWLRHQFESTELDASVACKTKPLQL